MNKIRQRIRNSLMAKIELVDFATMSKDDYGAWIDALPPPEFIELISLHDELKRQQSEEPPIDDVPPEKQNGPEDGAWIPSGEEMPVAGDVRIYVLFFDGDIGGPNRADAFIWGEPRGPSRIVAHALAEPTP